MFEFCCEGRPELSSATSGRAQGLGVWATTLAALVVTLAAGRGA